MPARTEAANKMQARREDVNINKGKLPAQWPGEAFKRPSIINGTRLIESLKAANTRRDSYRAQLVASPLLLLISLASACDRIHFGGLDVACRCNETYCDLGPTFDWPSDGSRVVRMVSSELGARFEVDQVPEEGRPPAQGPDPERLVEVNLNRRLQQVLGFGGAFTDSASRLLNELPPRTRKLALESYFGPKGLDYNLARVPIGGTDMSWRPYSLDDIAPDSDEQDDFEFKHFQLQPEDLEHKLPLIGEALAMRRPLGGLKLLAASWSAPNWMKTGNSLVQGQLKGNSSGPYYAAYARYALKFIEAYEARLNASWWALSPQNEPCTPGRLGYQVVNYNSVNFEPRQMADYLRLHLVPQLLQSGRTPDKLALFVWDDTLLGLDRYRDHLFSDFRVRQYVRGLALHWYSHGLDKLPYRVLYEMRRWLPHKFSWLSTEASHISRPKPGDWSRGARYARDIIESLRAGSVGWIDWNLALNREGGPSWSSNFLDAAMIVDEAERVVYKSAMFYAIGHITRFLKAGSSILQSSVRAPSAGASGWRMVDEAGEQTSELLVAAAELEPAGGSGWRPIGLVLLNRSPRSLRTRINLTGCKARPELELELAGDSITSLALNC